MIPVTAISFEIIFVWHYLKFVITVIAFGILPYFNKLSKFMMLCNQILFCRIVNWLNELSCSIGHYWTNIWFFIFFLELWIYFYDHMMLKILLKRILWACGIYICYITPCNHNLHSIIYAMYLCFSAGCISVLSSCFYPSAFICAWLLLPLFINVKNYYVYNFV